MDRRCWLVLQAGLAFALALASCADDGARKKRVNEPCANNTDCADRICHAGVCAASSEAALANGQSCQGAGECRSFVCTGGVCVAGTSPAGAECLFDEECDSRSCVAGRCADPSRRDSGADASAADAQADQGTLDAGPGDSAPLDTGVAGDSSAGDALSCLGSDCEFGSKCYADQTADPSGCLKCDVATSRATWTAAAGVTALVSDFEQGVVPAGWTASSSDASVGWTVTNRRAGAGAYALYYGDPTVGSYDTPQSSNQGTVSLPPIALVAGKKAGLSFLLWMDTELSAMYDVLEVYVGATKVWTKDTTTVPQMKVWQEVSVDLSAYAGGPVELMFKFDTVDGVKSGEGLYIDNVTVFHDC